MGFPAGIVPHDILNFGDGLFGKEQACLFPTSNIKCRTVIGNQRRLSEDLAIEKDLFVPIPKNGNWQVVEIPD